MDKQELIEALEDSRAEFMDILADVPDDALEEGGVAGFWSVRDILGHLSFWEGQLVALLFHTERSIEKPNNALFNGDHTPINARRHAESVGRSFENIYADFVGVRKQLIRRVRECNDQDFDDAERFSYLRGISLAELIEREALDHEALHAEQIGDWLERREAGRSGSNGVAHV